MECNLNDNIHWVNSRCLSLLTRQALDVRQAVGNPAIRLLKAPSGPPSSFHLRVKMEPLIPGWQQDWSPPWPPPKWRGNAERNELDRKSNPNHVWLWLLWLLDLNPWLLGLASPGCCAFVRFTCNINASNFAWLLRGDPLWSASLHPSRRDDRALAMGSKFGRTMERLSPGILWLSMMAALLFGRLPLVGTEKEGDPSSAAFLDVQSSNCSQLTLKMEFSSKVVEHGKST